MVLQAHGIFNILYCCCFSSSIAYRREPPNAHASFGYGQHANTTAVRCGSPACGAACLPWQLEPVNFRILQKLGSVNLLTAMTAVRCVVVSEDIQLETTYTSRFNI